MFFSHIKSLPIFNHIVILGSLFVASMLINYKYYGGFFFFSVFDSSHSIIIPVIITTKNFNLIFAESEHDITSGLVG